VLKGHLLHAADEIDQGAGGFRAKVLKMEELTNADE
jgi:hypothetical protein